MSSALILLTGHREAPYLIDYIRGYSTTLPIIHATDLEDLERECLPGRVLIAFCTAVIVPAALLDRLGGRPSTSIPVRRHIRAGTRELRRL